MKKLIFLFCALCAGHLFAQQEGTLDGDFDGDGMVNLDFTDIFSVLNLEGKACALQSDGKILFLGNNADWQQEYVKYRLNPDASIDESYTGLGQGASGYFDSFVESARATAIVASSDGNNIIGGTVTDTLGFNSFAFESRGLTGHATPGFGNFGSVILNWKFPSPAGLEALALQPDGKVVAVGFETELDKSHFAIVRLNTDGTLDNSFSFDGLATATLGISDFAQDVLIQPDGKILVAGSANNGQGHAFAFIRFNTNGTLDNFFGNAGKAVFSFPNTEEAFLSSIQLQSDGKIVAGGFVYEGNECDLALLRLTSNGNLDVSFGNGGVVTTSFPNQIVGTFEGISSIAIQNDGRILAVGESSNAAVIVRYMHNGLLDDSFGLSGFVSTQYPGSITTSASDCLLQPDGKLLIVGTTYQSPTDADPFMARYLTALNVGTINPLGNTVEVLLYPNPVPADATFGFELESAAEVSMSIMDLQGKLLNQPLLKSNFPTGKQEVSLSLGDLVPGNYLLVLQAGAHVVTTKFIKN